MFSQALLFSLFTISAIAAPAPSMNNGGAPSIIHLKSNVSCTSITPSDNNPTPSPSVILLNNPTPSPSVIPTEPGTSSSYPGFDAVPQPAVGGTPPVILLNAPTPSPSIIRLNNPFPAEPSASNSHAGYDAIPQPASTPPVINLNAPATAPTVIKLNKRQLSSTSLTSSFSFGGIVPPSAPPFPAAATTSSSSSSNFGGFVSPPPPAPTVAPNFVAPNGPSIFTSTGTDGVKTVLLLSTVTVTDSLCSTPAVPAVPNPSVTPFFAPESSSVTPLFTPPSSSPANALSSTLLGVNAQAPVIPPPSPSIINLTPGANPSTPAFSFSSTPSPSITPAPFPVQAAAPSSCGFSCLLTATV